MKRTGAARRCPALTDGWIDRFGVLRCVPGSETTWHDAETVALLVPGRAERLRSGGIVVADPGNVGEVVRAVADRSEFFESAGAPRRPAVGRERSRPLPRYISRVRRHVRGRTRVGSLTGQTGEPEVFPRVFEKWFAGDELDDKNVMVPPGFEPDADGPACFAARAASARVQIRPSRHSGC